MSASDARRSLVSGDVRLTCSHSVIMSRSYVWPSAAMTGSSMTSRLMGQRKSEASISLGSLCGPGWWLVCARAPSASRRSSRPSSLSARRSAGGGGAARPADTGGRPCELGWLALGSPMRPRSSPTNTLSPNLVCVPGGASL